MVYAFDRFLVIACIFVVLALGLYFFYWNRFIAFLLGLVFRVLYWNQGPFSVWLEIGSIHFSLLSGRVLFKDVAYHSGNQTIRIVKGQLEWRYWIRRPASAHDIAPPRAMDDLKQTRSSSCRVQISLQGVEWYLYNRTAAYDSIVAQLGVKVPPDTSRPASRNTGHQSSTQAGYSPSVLVGAMHVPAFLQKAAHWVRQELPTLDPKDLLPLGVEVTNGAITCGNPSTPNLLVVEFKRTEGMFGIVQSRSKHDLYKQLLHFVFQQPIVRYVQNDNYRGPMTATGELLHIPVKKYSKRDHLSRYLSYEGFVRTWRNLKLYSLMRKYPTNDDFEHRNIPKPTRSGGKHKSIDEETPVGADFTSLEYAIERKILEAPALELTYYTDVVGEVPALPHSIDIGPGDIGNGDMGPEWGVDLVIRGGILRYGPWADRQRAELQKTFFPPTYQNFEQTPRLKPGDKRVWTAMQVFVELRDDTTLYIPFREASKNWQWDGQTAMQRRPKRREPASIHVTVGDRSSINYILPMVANSAGYESVLEVHLDTVAVTSSLNDIQLVRGELPSPLQWNALRTWKFAISLRLPVLYLLRDHINMFTDLAKDWASGPPSDYHRFVPTKYAVDLDLHHYELNLYVNDNNIVDKPLVREENALLTARGIRLRSANSIPSDLFRPEATTVPFSVEMPDVAFNLSLPRWNTWALHAPSEGTNIAKIRLLKLDGSYRYFSDVSEDHVEQLKLSFTVRDIAYKAVGWSIRYFMILQANYFGSFTTFSTLYEYLEKRKGGLQGDPVELQYRAGQRNMLQVDLDVDLQNGTMILPAGLPGYEGSDTLRDAGATNGDIGSCLVLDMPEIQVHFRLHDYYMELSLNIGPIVGWIEPRYPEIMSYTRLHRRPKELLIIDGIDVTANRLFGPMPRTITYVCIWEIKLGCVKTVISAADLAILAAAGRSFQLNFVDAANAPAAVYQIPSYPDVTFVKFSLLGLDATWRSNRNAIFLSLPGGLNADMNDAGGHYHRKVTRLKIPSIFVRLLVQSLPADRRWLEVAHLETDAHLDIYAAPAGWKEIAAKQAAFVAEQDLPTDRAKRLLARGKGILHSKGVYLPQPQLSDARQYWNRIPALPRRSVQPSAKRPSWQKLPQFSESDEDDTLDRDRDAALARTRTETPMGRNFDEDSMTGGDESDTEDLHEETSSDEDWSDMDELGEPVIPSLKAYSRVCGQYVGLHLETPSKWDGSPFSTVKTRPRPARPGRIPALKAPVAVPPRDDTSVTVYRFESKKGVDISATPLVVSVLDCLEAEFGEMETSAELQIDHLLANYLAKFGKPDSPSVAVFDARLSLHVTLLHHVALGDLSGFPSSPTARLSPDGMTSIALSVAEMQISGTGPRVEAQFADLSVELSPELGITAQLAVSSFSLSSSKDNPQITLGAVTAQASHQSLEHMAMTGIAASRTVRELMAVVKRSKRRTSRTIYDLVHAILSASRQHSIVDPLSTIQPSFLVQTGLPHALRVDTAFRLVFHLRNCLWEIGPNIPVLIGCEMEEVGAELESRLAVLGADAMHEDHVSSLYALFPELEEKPAEAARVLYPKLTGTLELQKLVVLLRDSAGGIATELVIADLLVNLRLETFDLDEVVHGYQSVGISQVSLRQLSRPKHQRISLAISTQEIGIAISPRLMPIAQEVLRLKRRYSSGSSSIRPRGISHGAPNRSIDVTTSIERIQVQAVAESLTFEFGLSGLRLVSGLLVAPRDSVPRSSSLSVTFQEVFVRARSPTDHSVRTLQDILASITLTACKANSLVRYEATATSQIRLVFSIDDFHFNVPRSALRLYRFAQQWRADFLPGIEATVNDLLAEVNRAPLMMKPLSPTPSRATQRTPSVHVHGYVHSFGVSLQVMHGTWLSWRVFDIVASLNSNGGLKTSFGLQFGSQIFSITSKSNTLAAAAGDTSPNTRLKVEFPSVTLCGDYNGVQIHAIVLVDFLEFKIKPAHWDTLLAVQQKFGQDFNDLVMLVHETRSKMPASKPNKRSLLKYSGFLKMRGFRIGLEGLSSTLFLECFDIAGSLDNLSRRMWSVTLADLALSLAPRAMIEPRNSAFNRQRRSAFVIVDLEIKGGDSASDDDVQNVLHTTITKIHAVMQASSIGEVGDFVDHLQAEMWDRKEQRAIELAAFKEKAQSILKTLEVNVEDEKSSDPNAWLKSYYINVSILNVGVAFPLTHDQTLEIPQTGSRDSAAVRAFLFSIKSIKFGARRGESGEAKMEDLSFQFVSTFRQSVASDFAGNTHETRNRLVYPEMTAQVRSVGLVSERNIWMGATVSGFILDIDSSIPDYIFSLIDVYEQGKERVSRLSASIPRATTPSTVDRPPPSQQYPALPTSNVFASLAFLSGKVRLYNKSASELSIATSMSHIHGQPTDQQVLAIGADVFNLPVVSVWAEYRATPASQKIGGNADSDPSMLVFKSTIHSSQNTLRPTTLLPFLAELVGRIDMRMRQASRRSGALPDGIDVSAPPSSLEPPINPIITEPVSKRTDNTVVPQQKFQMVFSLRIDKSKLELTCQPDVNVIAGLHWDSGGFVLHVSPGARKVTLTGSIGGLNVGLKHGFLSEECAKLDMRNLSFSVTFAKTALASGRSISSVSFVLDTEILGAVRFSRLQDILCFKAVWLDRIPVFNATPADPPKPAATSSAPPAVQEFTTILLIRIRQISLEVDFGQSISSITLDLREAVAQTKITEEFHDLLLYVSDVAIGARGNLSGHANVSNCIFQTIRRVQTTADVRSNRMLELRMTSDALVVVLESDHQKLLYYRAEPLEVDIFDDWSEVDSADRTLRLAASVASPEVVAVVTIGTIPKMLSYANKFKANLEAQHEGASRESKTFHLSRIPNPEKPLSAVAEAMLLSAKSRFKEATDAGLEHVVKQSLRLRLGMLRLVVFPRTMGDLEMAQFVGSEVGARLERLVKADTPPHRDLRLSFAYMTISRFTQLGHLLPPSILANGYEWMSSLTKDAVEAIIVGLPSMEIHMVSDENSDTKALEYDFDSRFNRQGARNFEDIYISLNVSLYSWLTLLRKNLTREMDQVKATAEWRTSVASAAPTGYRRKAPDNIQIQSEPVRTMRPPVKSATLAHPIEIKSPTLKPDGDAPSSPTTVGAELSYQPRKRQIQRLTMRQLGEATPDVMHPFFMKKAGFNLEDSFPQYVNEYATRPLEEIIMEGLLKVYTRQLLAR
ncbi:hypothetical protein MKEN_00682400 [Mycena kentingensis (nom. inval.)]|nr:hypothetical protein MKEN_00682400 [Mycena kentingensis (nom. inval.)]